MSARGRSEGGALAPRSGGGAVAPRSDGGALAPVGEREVDGAAAARAARSRYQALLVDLDGTLLDSRSELESRNRDALRAAEAAGVRVVVVTGRSKLATQPVLAELCLSTPAVIFNGAAVWCAQSERLLEERTLSGRTLERVLAYGAAHGDLTLVQRAEDKFALQPRGEHEERALAGLRHLRYVPREELRRDHTIRVTFLSERLGSSAALADELTDFVGQPMYLTHFPLAALPMHRASRVQAVDVHPPCRGKAEAFRLLEDRYGILPERVVAIGDASNDVPMLREAGLGVAMEGSMSEALAVADRVIGHHDTDAIARLVEELFLQS